MEVVLQKVGFQILLNDNFGFFIWQLFLPTFIKLPPLDVLKRCVRNTKENTKSKIKLIIINHY